MGLTGLKDSLQFNRVVLCLSSGNPLVDSSGTSKVILRDRDAFFGAGISYLLLLEHYFFSCDKVIGAQKNE